MEARKNGSKNNGEFHCAALLLYYRIGIDVNGTISVLEK